MNQTNDDWLIENNKIEKGIIQKYLPNKSNWVVSNNKFFKEKSIININNEKTKEDTRQITNIFIESYLFLGNMIAMSYFPDEITPRIV